MARDSVNFEAIFCKRTLRIVKVAVPSGQRTTANENEGLCFTDVVRRLSRCPKTLDDANPQESAYLLD